MYVYIRIGDFPVWSLLCASLRTTMYDALRSTWPGDILCELQFLLCTVFYYIYVVPCIKVPNPIAIAVRGSGIS